MFDLSSLPKPTNATFFSKLLACEAKLSEELEGCSVQLPERPGTGVEPCKRGAFAAKAALSGVL